MIFNRWQRIFLVSVCVCVCVAILLGTVVTANATPTLLKQGSQEPISLAGQWQFYWGQLLSPADFAPSSGTAPQGGTIAVPSSWAGQVLGPNVNAGQPLPFFGVATYRTRVVLPPEKVGTHTVLVLENIGSAYRVWVNGVPVGGLGHMPSGNPATDNYAETPQIRLNIINITPKTEQIDIVIQVSNYSFRESGIFGDVKIGPLYLTMIHVFNHYILQDLLLIGVFVVVGLYHVMIYLLGRRDNELLWLAGVSLAVALRALLLNKFLVYAIFPDASWELLMHLQFIAKYTAIFTYIYLIRALYRQDVNEIVHRVFVVACIGAMIYVSSVPPSVSTQTINIQTTIIVIILGYYLCVVGYYLLLRKREGAWLNLVCMLFVVVAIIHDTLLYSNRIQSVQFIPYMMLLTLLTQAIIISYRYTLFQQRNVQLALDLQENNRLLEEKVIARTDALNASNAQLIELTSQRSRLMTNIAHDMGSPMIGIQSSLQMLTSDTLSDKEKQNFFQLLTARTNYVKQLIDDLFRLAKLESRQWTFDWDDSAVHDLYAEMSTYFARIVQTQGRMFVIEPADASTFAPDIMVHVDRQQLFRVLQNLIDNAIKYSIDPQTPVTLRSVVRQSTVASTYEWYVAVVDHGVGIDPAHLPLIFERFYTRSNGLQAGSGLGLAICKEIIERHGGMIGAQSTPGEGSTFFFTVPIVE
jgi:signal transduction histidine kinase